MRYPNKYPSSCPACVLGVMHIYVERIKISWINEQKLTQKYAAFLLDRFHFRLAIEIYTADSVDEWIERSMPLQLISIGEHLVSRSRSCSACKIPRTNFLFLPFFRAAPEQETLRYRKLFNDCMEWISQHVFPMVFTCEIWWAWRKCHTAGVECMECGVVDLCDFSSFNFALYRENVGKWFARILPRNEGTKLIWAERRANIYENSVHFACGCGVSSFASRFLCSPLSLMVMEAAHHRYISRDLLLQLHKIEILSLFRNDGTGRS